MNTSKNWAQICAKVGAMALVLGVASSASAAAIERQLEVGMSGSDISVMQAYLAKDATVYPQGLITGYFGFLTKAAVSNFQSNNGLSPVGRVGPQTLPVLNLAIERGGSGGSSSGGSSNWSSAIAAPIINTVNLDVGSDTAVIEWRMNENARGGVYFDDQQLNAVEGRNSVTTTGEYAPTSDNYSSAQEVTLEDLESGTTYHYMVYVTDENGNVSVTWPSTFRTSGN
jgi:peptidoglycan hydrolase-like protein with peptidoglycan-binding domain